MRYDFDIIKDVAIFLQNFSSEFGQIIIIINNNTYDVPGKGYYFSTFQMRKLRQIGRITSPRPCSQNKC